jgi:hypothetical protein
MIWKLRLAIGRWLLEAAPEGVELYFRSNRVHTRRKRTSFAEAGEMAERIFAISPRENCSDWSEVLEAGL